MPARTLSPFVATDRALLSPPLRSFPSASSSSTSSSPSPTLSREEAEAEIALHPDARAPLRAEFAGDVNPRTGERGGPKREPVGRWGADPDGGGEWSFKGRVSDF